MAKKRWKVEGTGPNIDLCSSSLPIQHSMLDVRCSMFIFFRGFAPTLFENELHHIREYIINNPDKWELD